MPVVDAPVENTIAVLRRLLPRKKPRLNRRMLNTDIEPRIHWTTTYVPPSLLSMSVKLFGDILSPVVHPGTMPVGHSPVLHIPALRLPPVHERRGHQRNVGEVGLVSPPERGDSGTLPIVLRPDFTKIVPVYLPGAAFDAANTVTQAPCVDSDRTFIGAAGSSGSTSQSISRSCAKGCITASGCRRTIQAAYPVHHISLSYATTRNAVYQQNTPRHSQLQSPAQKHTRRFSQTFSLHVRRLFHQLRKWLEE